MPDKEVTLDMIEFGCPSCAYAIERNARRIPGIRDIRVDLASHEIRVRYDGNAAAIQALQEVVSRLGHEAKPRTEDA